MITLREIHEKIWPKEIPSSSLSEDGKEWCEDCHDTGVCGDDGPGRANAIHEWVECDCDVVARARRIQARRAVS